MKALSVLLFSLILFKCIDSKSVLSDMKILTNQTTYKLGDTLNIKIKNISNKLIDSLKYFLNDQKINQTHVFNNEKLGDYNLKVKIHKNGKPFESLKKITLLNNIQPKLHTYTIINEYPHNINSYTQGLEFDGEDLYEGTGLNGQSSLIKIAYKNGSIKKKKPLSNDYFGEGITIINDKIIQLTWKSKIGFIYNKETMNVLNSFNYDQSVEGWGLCNDGDFRYKSDGSNRIWRLNPANYNELDNIQVMTNKSKINKLNELEWVNGEIYANTYQFNKEVVVIIDPRTGAVNGVIDFSGLKEKVEQHSNLNVLNGIAYHRKRKTLFVTGKNWSKLFEVKIIPLDIKK